ncbi:hypothetical protein [Verrucomicrobium sp. BvORR034]|uniref:hypothetical protein n=1 Tax=Verrucomicrobium sp. BvORR034 TaxID=1396418 RepID=UPI002240FADE|nr:hypothetical protein [Verrucomicrobium sp. BvORR034]
MVSSTEPQAYTDSLTSILDQANIKHKLSDNIAKIATKRTPREIANGALNHARNTAESAIATAILQAKHAETDAKIAEEVYKQALKVAAELKTAGARRDQDDAAAKYAAAREAAKQAKLDEEGLKNAAESAAVASEANLGQIYRFLLSLEGATDYFDQQIVYVTTLKETKTKLFEAVTPAQYADLNKFLSDLDFTPKQGTYENGNTLQAAQMAARQISLRYSTSLGALLVVGPARFVEVVTATLDGLKQSKPEPKFATYGVRRVHCRHALVTDRKLGGDLYVSELVVPGVFTLLKGVLGETSPNVSFANSPPALITGGRDISGAETVEAVSKGAEAIQKETAAAEQTSQQSNPGMITILPAEPIATTRTETTAAGLPLIIPAEQSKANAFIERIGARQLNKLFNSPALDSATRLEPSGVPYSTPESSNSDNFMPQAPPASGAEPDRTRKHPPPQAIPRPLPTSGMDAIFDNIEDELSKGVAHQEMAGTDPNLLLPLVRWNTDGHPPVALGPTPGGHYSELGKTFDVRGTGVSRATRTSGGEVVAENRASIFAADPRTNSIHIMGPIEMLDFYEDLVRSLDLPQMLVEISAAIVDVDSSNTYEWNTQLAGSVTGEIQDKKATLGGGFDSKNLFKDLTDAAGPAIKSGLVDGTGLNVAGLLVGESYQVLGKFRALESEGQARFISRPNVMTLDNVMASLTDTTTFFVPVQAREDAKLYQVRAQTRIKVHPHIVFEESPTVDHHERASRVRLLIDIEDGSTNDETTTSSSTIVDGNGTTVSQVIPSLATSRISTQAEVFEGQSLLIGGRYRNEQVKNQGHVPIIGKIPVIGLAFRGKEVTHRRMQRLFIITPRIVDPTVPSGSSGRRIETVMKQWADSEKEKTVPTRTPVTTLPQEKNSWWFNRKKSEKNPARVKAPK